ncbi:MAG TPA: GNAT family N-acetyltransferase [Vicinamibacterales bacterium]|nr:GNAT family N-acetyltransferase [Vicinamibacterales bacterium]
MIRTPRLDLALAKEKQLRAELEGRAALAAALRCDVPDGWPPEFYDADAVNYSLNWLLKHPSDAEWGFYYFLERISGARPVLVGAGGFKGAPDADGLVELGYSIVPERRRRGYATEAVRGMLAFAFADARVRTVIGQTLPSLPGSIGVLEKAGFRFTGAGHDPDAPPGEQVIRYAIAREHWRAAPGV